MFTEMPVAFVAVAFAFALVIGSFLNVVIYRLPIMMQRDWRDQCDELKDELPDNLPEGRFNLIVPRSRCPDCGAAIKAWQNIPVLSYLLLGAQCANCRKPVSLRYPIVELSTAFLAGWCAWHFGFGWEAVMAIVLTFALIAVSLIDVDHQLIPDSIVLPLLWIGLVMSLFAPMADTQTLFVAPRDAIIGALAGYLSLWSVYQLFKLITGKEGMGYGDFKLLAALGAWLGPWPALPMIILLSAVVGAVVGVAMIVIRGRDRQLPIPFGPYLAAAGWITMLYGETIWNSYLGMFQ
ncbi:MAG: prepilin peptidase [Woeseiaceae bacterium]|nr:prepilin peptidase [Woeseiaceae bacterium]NIP21196.1 prepilin peptidase [Woeseiaceae bacterium]NIS90168.1 prepilin peptidase [Woeseiaceae bacterium]